DPCLRGVKVFAITGAPQRDFDIATGPDGVDAWFSKPLNPDALWEAMRRSLEGGKQLGLGFRFQISDCRFQIAWEICNLKSAICKDSLQQLLHFLVQRADLHVPGDDFPVLADQEEVR